jgi:hypothetical protein
LRGPPVKRYEGAVCGRVKEHRQKTSGRVAIRVIKVGKAISPFAGDAEVYSASKLSSLASNVPLPLPGSDRNRRCGNLLRAAAKLLEKDGAQVAFAERRQHHDDQLTLIFRPPRHLQCGNHSGAGRYPDE